MDTEMQNANPTVKDISDLPTRLGKPTTQERSKLDELFDSLNHPPRPPFDPFASYLSSPAGSVSGSSEDGQAAPEGLDAEEYEPIDEQEIYDLISTISDPEHPLTLGALSVVNLADIKLTPLNGGGARGATTEEKEQKKKTMSKRDPRRQIMVCTVEITPTITHCSLATVIGLGVRVRLERSLPPRFRVEVKIKEGTHSTGDQVTKQLGDKERVAAALENQQLMDVVTNMLKTCR